MSHFATVVLLPLNTIDIEGAIDELLAPYAEELEVEEYETDCWCIGAQAQEEAHQAAERIVGSLEDIRRQFKEDYKVEQERANELGVGIKRELTGDEVAELSALQERLQMAWQTALAPFEAAEREALEGHPHKDKPKLNCEDCGSTGRVLSTANPHAKWDWYQIGGRFTGLFDSEYKPAKDPANWETCHVCGGLGVRTDYAYWFKGDTLVASYQLDALNRPGGAMEPSSSGAPNEAEETVLQAFIVGSEEQRESKEPLPTISEGAERRPWCNGCHGEGRRLKWPTQWQQYEGDIMPVCALPHNVAPFSIVTPDGTWYEQGEMGWWGMVGNKQNTEVWERKCRALLDEHAHCIAVICDLHI